jgi:P27 family predicted phage terminase small subunit
MKGKNAIPLKLTGIDNTASKAQISEPVGQPKPIIRLFRQILSELNGTILTQQDGHAILLLAKDLRTIAIADKEILRQGYVIETKTGYTQPNCYVAIRNRSESNALKIMKQLGMTPASRKEQGAKPIQETSDPLDRFLDAG